MNLIFGIVGFFVTVGATASVIGFLLFLAFANHRGGRR